MPKIGDFVKLKVIKVYKNGAALTDFKGNEYYLHIKESLVNPTKKYNMNKIVEVNDEFEAMVIGEKWRKNIKVFDVSLKNKDPNSFKKESFEKRIKDFMKVSNTNISQLNKNNERKRNNGKRKKRIRK